MLLFFSLGIGEVVIIMLVALIFFGSKGLPDVARTLGRTMRQMRDASQEVQREIRKGTSEVQQKIEESAKMPRPTKSDPDKE